jgi:hypothetical protein
LLLNGSAVRLPDGRVVVAGVVRLLKLAMLLFSVDALARPLRAPARRTPAGKLTFYLFPVAALLLLPALRRRAARRTDPGPEEFARSQLIRGTAVIASGRRARRAFAFPLTWPPPPRSARRSTSNDRPRLMATLAPIVP